MHSLPSIQRLGRIMRIICLLGMALLFLAQTAIWIFPSTEAWQNTTEYRAYLHGHDLTLVKRGLGWAITMLPTGFSMLGLWFLSGVFAQYGQGKIFSHEAVNGLRRVGLAGMAVIPAVLLSNPLMSLAMTYDLGPGNREIAVSIGISNSGLMAFSAAVMFYSIAWVMSEARRNAQDLSQIV